MKKAQDGELMRAIAEKLEAMPALARFSQAEGGAPAKEAAWEIAHGLVDIRQATRNIFEELLPRLLELHPGSEEAEDLLFEIGEDYRHIGYHIRDARFFAYVVPADE